jgi:hypothetical protein
MVLSLDIENLRRSYENWGPSARTCVSLSRDPIGEDAHEGVVTEAARCFFDPDPIKVKFDPVNNPHVLFSIRPKSRDEEGRRTPIADVATDRIQKILSYAAAAAQAQERINFYHMISTQPMFKTFTGQMFKRFVLSWLACRSDVDPLYCSPALPDSPVIEIPACGKERTTIFGSQTALKKTEVDGLKHPLCLLPTSQALTAVDAIIFTKEFIITVQVTIASEHSAKNEGFVAIEEAIPSCIQRNRKWCHVFITDNATKAKIFAKSGFERPPREVSHLLWGFQHWSSGHNRNGHEDIGQKEGK